MAVSFNVIGVTYKKVQLLLSQVLPYSISFELTKPVCRMQAVCYAVAVIRLLRM